MFFQAVRDIARHAHVWMTPNLRHFLAARMPFVWLICLLIGLLVALAAIAFRALIGAVQFLWIGTPEEKVAGTAQLLPAWQIMAGPVVGGLLVGLALAFVQPGRKTGGVADVIEARLDGGRHLGLWRGLCAACVTALSLGCGASAGREGPVVHLGASLAHFVRQRLNLPDNAHRVLMAAGVASAISASFNAPIAGILFACEVVLGHYAISAFAPLVIASVAGAVLSRLWFGEQAAFIIPDYQLVSYWEIPFFALLGLICACVAILFQFALVGTDRVARAVPMPLWLRPLLGGIAIGAIGVVFPEILGVGYQMTDAALQARLPLIVMLALIIMKTIATAITLAARFGGGIFSPALYLGAMTGGAFGLISASVFPELASSHGLYALIGMGSVAAAILGAPVSTAVIVFELTGGYAISIALLLSVSIAVGLCRAVHGRSFFHWQLEMRGVRIRHGSYQYLRRNLPVSEVMKPLGTQERAQARIDRTGRILLQTDSLSTAMNAFDETGAAFLYVAARASEADIIGRVTHIDVLRHYVGALVAHEREAND